MAYRKRAELTPEARMTIVVGLKADVRARDMAEMALARALKEAQRHGMSVEEIAAALGVAKSTVSRWSRTEGGTPRAAA